MTLREELHVWLTELPVWQQELCRRLTMATELDAENLEEVRRLVYAAYGALAASEQPPEAAPLALDDLPGATGTDPARLLRIGNLRNVGLVADDQALEFARDGLTLIYGPNGVGKSTYVAALKRVCRTVDRESNVRPNVFDTPSGERSTALVDYIHAGEHRAQQVDLENPADLGLDGVSVFDARCAELYLNSRNAVAYVPTSLAVLARLAGAQDTLRRRVEADVAALERSGPEFSNLPIGSTAHSRVASLSADTNIDEIRELSQLSEVERARLAEVRAALATAEANNAQADAQAAREEAERARATFRLLEDLATRVADVEVRRIRGEANDLAAAVRAVEDAAAELAASAAQDVGGTSWQRMWTAARAFVEASENSFPPGIGDPCPLCLQQLDAAAAERMAHFERHVQSALQQQARDAQERFDASRERIDPALFDALGPVLPDGVAAEWRDLAVDVTRLRDAVAHRMRDLASDPIPDTLDPLPTVIPQRVEDWAAAREAHADMLATAADPDGESELRSELSELDGRSSLGEQLDDVAGWIATLRQLEALRRARAALATNRITTKQRELSTRVVTESLATALTEELNLLSCEHLPVDIQPYTAIGETQLALHLAGAYGTPRVSEVLSEGEQRAVSLAFFFAETRTAEHAGGIVVDDPVSSLDDERRSYIARRLAEEASRRQVVVLTHDLPFMLDLLDAAKARGIDPKLQGMWRLGSSVGRVDPKLPFTAMRFRERLGELTHRVEQWDNQSDPRDADEAWHRVCGFYGDMRTTWECGVEERLFQGVVRRFQREIKTRELPHVRVTDELLAAIEDGMTRCSLFVHDAAPGTRTALPGRVQLAADVGELRAFQRATARDT